MPGLAKIFVPVHIYFQLFNCILHQAGSSDRILANIKGWISKGAGAGGSISASPQLRNPLKLGNDAHGSIQRQIAKLVPLEPMFPRGWDGTVDGIPGIGLSVPSLRLQKFNGRVPKARLGSRVDILHLQADPNLT